MPDENLTVEIIKQLPLATVAIIACVALWRKIWYLLDQYFIDLRENKAKEIADLRARVMVLEDLAHVPRMDRYKYLPDMNIPKASDLKDLD